MFFKCLISLETVQNFNSCQILSHFLLLNGDWTNKKLNFEMNNIEVEVETNLDEVIIFKIIEKIIPEMGDDIEQISFFASEILRNLQDALTSKDKLNEILGEHLINNGFAENFDKSADLCEDIFELLKNPPQEDLQELQEDFEDGICVLCEREMALTFHHLIPRMTHKKMMKKGLTKNELNVGIMVLK
jgi:hypothetical protein